LANKPIRQTQRPGGGLSMNLVERVVATSVISTRQSSAPA
jgi:hypothetical protein